MYLNVVHANKNHKDFLIYANKAISCATGEGNERMQKILKYYGGVEMNNLKFYYKKI